MRGGPGGRAGGPPGSFRPQDGGAGAASGTVGPARPAATQRAARGGRSGRRAARPGRSAAGGSGGGGFGGGGFGGGLLGSPTPGAEVVTALERDASAYTWAAAAVGSNTAAGYQLATQLPVLAVGGFNGTDPAPTLEQFQQLVADGRVHWFVGADRAGTCSGTPAAAAATRPA